MYRLYCPSQNISEDKIAIKDKNQVHHLKDVLRFRINEPVVIFDDRGIEYRSILEKISSASLTFKIQEKNKSMPGPEKIKITVACAIPKKSKMEDIIDKLTQLGVERIIPLLTERVIVKLDRHKETLRLKRWMKVALNASQQSQRNTLPVIEPVKKIGEVISGSGGYDLKLIPTLEGERRTLKDVFVKTKAKNILFIIGPEGDFTPQEISLAKKAGFIPVSLGDSVLRVETAAVAVASFMRLYADS